MPKCKKLMWKSFGVEDKFIQKLIREGKIDRDTTASMMQKEYPQIFGKFSNPVVRNHLNDIKRRNLLLGKIYLVS